MVRKVEITIDDQGKIANVDIINPLPPAFDTIAYDAIRKGTEWILVI